MSEPAVIPVPIRVHLAHAVAQSLAEECGADVLHVKGPALDPSLCGWRTSVADDGTLARVPLPRLSTDVDVLVRPSHVKRYMETCVNHGWRVVTRFSTGSAFEHAATLWHDQLGYMDVHRFFPGIGLRPEEAFNRFWADRQTIHIAHRACQVPAVGVQRLLILLHAARSGTEHNRDLTVAWDEADDEARREVRKLAHVFDAQVAFAAATGSLDAFRSNPSHDLWEHFATRATGDRLAEWRARFKAENTWSGRLRLVGRAFVVNTDHLAMELGHRPTPREIGREYAHRARAGASAVLHEGGRFFRRGRAT